MVTRNNIVMLKLARPKQITLPNSRAVITRYKRAKRTNLPENVVLKKRHKQRSAPKSKRRRVRRSRGLGLTIKTILRKLVVRKLGKETLKKTPLIYNKLTKKIKHKKIRRTQHSKMARNLVEKGLQYTIDRIQFFYRGNKFLMKKKFLSRNFFFRHKILFIKKKMYQSLSIYSM